MPAGRENTCLCVAARWLLSEVEDLNDYKSSKAYSYFQQGWLGLLSYHSLGESPYCFLKSDCRPSQRLSDTRHKLWLLLSKSDEKVIQAHCTCMAGMGSTCNHVAAALFRIEAAMRLGLSNPACTTKPCEWLPNRKYIAPCQVKDRNLLNRDDFSKRGKVTRKLLNTPKKNYNPLHHCSLKALNFKDIADALEKEDVIGNTILSTAIPRPEIDFVRTILSEKLVDDSIPCVDDMILMSQTVEEFMQNLSVNFSKETILKIEQVTLDQSTNQLWYEQRKSVITASKVHEVKTKMTKVNNGSSTVNMWSLIQKISRLTFTNPNIASLKYRRDMESVAAIKLAEILKKDHQGLLWFVFRSK